MIRQYCSILVGLFLVGFSRGADGVPIETEKLPEGAKVVKLVGFPAKVDLTGPFIYRQLVVTAFSDRAGARKKRWRGRNSGDFG